MGSSRAIETFQPQRRRSMRAQITDAVREMVVSGTLQAGARLPSTQELAAQWQVTAPTVHDALTPLVKEGLLERTPRVGTFVREREEKLARVGIYVNSSVWSRPSSAFGRALCRELQDQLAGMRITESMWVDPRPHVEQATAWQDLVQAAAERRFQVLLVPTSDIDSVAWLDKLPVPVVFLCSMPLPNRVTIEQQDWAAKAMRMLADQGCRRVGVVSALKMGFDAGHAPVAGHADFYRHLFKEAERLGLELRPEWIMHAPPEGFRENGVAFQQFGYAAMNRLWSCPERPGGLAVHDDVTASGVIMAIMQAQIDVPGELKLALHRNAEIGLFCPFPAAFIDVRVAEVAAAMIDQAKRLYHGEDVAAVVVPHHASPAAANQEPATRLKAPALAVPLSESAHAMS